MALLTVSALLAAVLFEMWFSRPEPAAPVKFNLVGYPFDSGDHNILWLAIGGPRKGLPIAPRFQACDGHGACVILDRPETQPRGPIACRPASGAPGCILGAVCWRPWIDQTTTPRGYLSQVDTPFSTFPHPTCGRAQSRRTAATLPTSRAKGGGDSGSGATERHGRASADRKVVRAGYTNTFPRTSRYVVRSLGLSPARGRGSRRCNLRLLEDCCLQWQGTSANPHHRKQLTPIPLALSASADIRLRTPIQAEAHCATAPTISYSLGSE